MSTSTLVLPNPAITLDGINLGGACTEARFNVDDGEQYGQLRRWREVSIDLIVEGGDGACAQAARTGEAVSVTVKPSAVATSTENPEISATCVVAPGGTGDWKLDVVGGELLRSDG